MHDYVFTTEVVRFAFMFGVAVSMLLYERRHLTTGSIVVPGYIATFLAMPLTIVATFANALISYWLVNKLLRRWFLLYGRTKFTVLAMISILIQTLMLQFSPTGGWLWESNIKLLVGVGYVVPALIAHDMGRQGMKKTVKSVSLAGLIVAAPIALALAVDMPGINDLAPLRGGGELAIEVGWIPIAVLLSAAAAWGVARFWGLRSGGFMGAAFVAILLGDPWQVLVTGVLAMMTYLMVTRLLMNSMILFGRRKFSAMLLVSASMSWILLWIGGELFDLGIQSHMDIGSLALTPLIVPGLLANDAQRTSPLHVLGGLAMATTFVLSATWWIQSVVEDRPLDLGWKISAVLSAIVIFGRTVFERIKARIRAHEARRRAEQGARTPAVAHAGTAADDTGSDPWYGWAVASYHKWAALHNEAAAAADAWLASMLGETPLVAAAGAGGATVAPRRQPAPVLPAVPAPSPAPAVPTTIERIRTAAQQALGGPAHTVTEPSLPQRRRPTPQRRPGGQRRGEFDVVSIELAQQAARIGRLDGLPNELDTDLATADAWMPSVAPDATGQPVASPRSRRPIAGDTISELSDADTTRAHQRAASDARSTGTPHRDGSD
jgi:poly-gamma-glutamate biosynthesis protein PgsC/CapC